MFISKAYAQEVVNDTAVMVGDAAPSVGGGVMQQLLLMGLLAILFYVLLIRPQQKRFAEHKVMLNALKKGDAVVTAGGLIGKIDKITDEDEVVVDLGSVKVTAVRSTIQSKADKAPVASKDKKPAKDSKAEKETKPAANKKGK